MQSHERRSKALEREESRAAAVAFPLKNWTAASLHRSEKATAVQLLMSPTLDTYFSLRASLAARFLAGFPEFFYFFIFISIYQKYIS